jgi:small GTP-binding protein
MSTGEEIDCKLVFVGESIVGKTSLINQYIKETFSNSTMPTFGGDKFEKKIVLEKSKKIKLVIWDTAGQEKYRSLNKIFLKGANIVLIVYDITRKKTFEEIKNFWYNNIIENVNNDIVFGIAGNKSDLYEQSQVNINDAEEYAKDINAIFSETTAMNHESINNLIFNLVKEFYSRIILNKGMQNNNNQNNISKLNNNNNKVKSKHKCCGNVKEVPNQK